MFCGLRVGSCMSVEWVTKNGRRRNGVLTNRSLLCSISAWSMVDVHMLGNSTVFGSFSSFLTCVRGEGILIKPHTQRAKLSLLKGCRAAEGRVPHRPLKGVDVRPSLPERVRVAVQPHLRRAASPAPHARCHHHHDHVRDSRISARANHSQSARSRVWASHRDGRRRTSNW